MKVFSLGKFRSKVWLLAFVSAVFASMALAQTLEANPVFDVGDKWTYRYQNTGDRKEPYLYTNLAFKSEAGSGWLYGESQNPQSSRKQFIWRYDYKRGEGKEGFEYDPSKPMFAGRRFSNLQPNDDDIQFPLAVGKKYAVTVHWNDGNGNTKYDAEVEAFEKVKTEAGEFDAFRIKLSGWWQRTKEGNSSGKAEKTIYFSPSTKRIVKSDYVDRRSNGSAFNANVTELVKWEPKTALPAAFVTQAMTPPAQPASAVQ